MKLGYSMLLGELVPADQAKRTDPVGFQIVCPCCKDPVFKVEREQVEKPIDFFSHYAGKEGVDECELRVAGISSQQREQANAVSRGQTLKMFLSVFRDTMMLHFRDDESTSADEMRYRNALAFAKMLKIRFEKDDWLDDEGLEDELDRALVPADVHRAREETGLDISYRRRLVRDILNHLRAPHAEKNRQFVAEFATRLIFRSEWKYEEMDLDNDDWKPIVDVMRSDDVEAFLEWFDVYSSKQSRKDDQVLAISNRAARTLLLAMAQIPVVRMLANHRAGRHPLHGITELDPLHLTPEAASEVFDEPGAPGL